MIMKIFHVYVYRLTDEESRKNWEEHGNPDGPGGIFMFHLKVTLFC